MTIEELATVLAVRLEIVQQPGLVSSKPWQARIVGAEVKEHGILISVYGTGDTPMDALASYCVEIAGETLVFDAYRETRREINVPSDLYVGSGA